jgi:hypothetical protein
MPKMHKTFPPKLRAGRYVAQGKAPKSLLKEDGDVSGVDGARGLDQTDGGRGTPDDVRGVHSRTPQLPDAGIAARLAQFLAARFDDQRMVEEASGRLPAEHPGQCDLPPG